jgi:hypothetical protein
MSAEFVSSGRWRVVNRTGWQLLGGYWMLFKQCPALQLLLRYCRTVCCLLTFNLTQTHAGAAHVLLVC